MRSTALRKGEFGDGFMQRWGLHSASALIALIFLCCSGITLEPVHVLPLKV